MIVKSNEKSKIAIIDSNLMTFKTMNKMACSNFDGSFVILQSEIVTDSRIMIEYMMRVDYEEYLKSYNFDEK